MAGLTIASDDKLRNALFHQRTFRICKRIQYVASGARKGPLIAWLLPPLERGASLAWSKARIDRDRRLLIREQYPVSVFFRQRAPRRINVITERDENIAQVLSVPCRRPSCDGAFTDAERGIGHHGFLGNVIDAPQSVTCRTGP